MATEADAVRKVLNIAERELNLEEYAGFLAAITPKVGDSVKELREYRDKASYEEILERLRRRGGEDCPLISHSFMGFRASQEMKRR